VVIQKNQIIINAILGISLTLLAIVPFFAGTYISFIFYTIMLYIVLGTAWNLVAGYIGLASFGNIALFAIGGYATGISMVRLGIHPAMAIFFAGGIGTAILCGIIFYPSFRLRGAYFLIVSIAIWQISRMVAMTWNEVTGGPMGVTMPLRPLHQLYDYYGMFVLMIASIYIVYRLTKSKIGLGFIAIREDEDAAESLGVSSPRIKMIGWFCCSMITGMAGGMYAWHQIFIDPEVLFPLHIAFIIVLGPIFGGLGTIGGPIIGAFILGILQQILVVSAPRFSTVIFGFLLAAMVIGFRSGIVGLIKRISSKIMRES
jgi:branched-chain amino acid transport system permease protein